MAKESTFSNMVLTLFLVTLFASTALGFIYELTKEPIEKAKLEKKNMAIQQVVPGYDNNPNDEAYEVEVDDATLTLYPAKKEGKTVGVAVETFTTKGFSGEFRLMVGFNDDGTINNISVLEHAETPGLGDKMESDKSDWSEQFYNKNPEEFNLAVKGDGGDVDAITAATITSSAYCDAVERAYKAFKKGGNQ
ncbi:MAG: RnfABCDGE type electron transport complex subunit G [Bacteroidales bacterium]